MKTKTFFLAFFLISVHSYPQSTSEGWYKGNLHTHSLWSDGDDFPEMIIDWYKENGYQFVAISDHNTIADKEKWAFVNPQTAIGNAFTNYLKRFDKWVETVQRGDSVFVKLKTFYEYKSLMDDVGKFLVIASEEVTTKFEDKPIHINVTNIQSEIQPQQGNSVVEVMQKTLNLVTQQRALSNAPVFAHINHPNFGYAIKAEDLMKLNGERFFEVYNGHPLVHNEGDENHIGTEEIWDLVNVSYFKQKKPLLLGLATDDSHNYHKILSKLSNPGRGWVMVNTDSLTTEKIITSLEKGNFYATSGVIIKTVRMDDKSYRVEIRGEEGVNYKIYFYGYQTGSENVREVAAFDGNTGEYFFTKKDLFVRAKIVSDKIKQNPYKAGEVEQAWTQPFLINFQTDN